MKQYFEYLTTHFTFRKSNQPMLGLLLFCYVSMVNVSAHATPIERSQVKYGLYPLLSQLEMPWAVKSDQESRLWITLMSGQIVVTTPINLYHDAQPVITQTIDLTLPELYVAGQGGLMDVILLSDSTATQKNLLVTYATGNRRANRLAIQHIKLSWVHTEERWDMVANDAIFHVTPSKSTPVHYGARLAQLADESILVTVGDGFDWREQALNKSSGLGKILRMSTTGEPLVDNPFYSADLSENLLHRSQMSGSQLIGSDPNIISQWVYTLGHRNAQGLLIDQAGLIWAHEHGPAGGDEINLIKAGQNYGWPVLTRGKDYSGANITPFSEYPGMIAPTVNWTPSIAPSGFIRYQNILFPELANMFLVTSLKLKGIIAVNVKGDKYDSQVMLDARKLPASNADEFTEDVPRLRDITTLPSGEILVLSDGIKGELFHLTKL